MICPMFSCKIMEESVPHRFKTPIMEAYDGISDLFNHLESFRSLILLQGALNALMCKTFLIAFKKVARA